MMSYHSMELQMELEGTDQPEPKDKYTDSMVMVL